MAQLLSLNEAAEGYSIASPFPNSKLVNVMSTWRLYWQATPGLGRLLQDLLPVTSCLAHTPPRFLPAGMLAMLCAQQRRTSPHSSRALTEGRASGRNHKTRQGSCEPKEQEDEAPPSVKKTLIYSLFPCSSHKGRSEHKAISLHNPCKSK